MNVNQLARNVNDLRQFTQNHVSLSPIRNVIFLRSVWELQTTGSVTYRNIKIFIKYTATHRSIEHPTVKWSHLLLEVYLSSNHRPPTCRSHEKKK